MRLTSRVRAQLSGAVLVSLLFSACETAATPTEPEPSKPPTQYRVTIALIGLDPSSIEVPVGARVTFVNNDTNYAHHMVSACGEVEASGLLQTGQWGQTAPFAGAKTCEYHDRLYPENPLRQGKIVVR
jgi:plastocyanin